jgi:hypothetical protein
MTMNAERATVRVKYSCPLCGLRDVAVDVTSRGEEDVVQWIEQVCMVELASDHATRSPHCHPLQLHDIKIPIAGAEKIGGVNYD